MERLRARDLKALLEFVRQLYAAHEQEAFVGLALRGLLKVVPADFNAYCEMNPTNSTSFNWFEPAEIGRPEWEGAWERVMHDHPVLTYYARTHDGRARTISDFKTAAQFHRLALYGDFYRRMSVEDVMCIALRCPGPRVIGVALSRDRRSFTERERLLLNLVRPHMVQSWENAKAFTRLQDRLRLSDQTLDALDCGLVVLDDSGRVKLMNTRARRYLEQYFPQSRPQRRTETLRTLVRQQEAMRTAGDTLPPRKPFTIEAEGKCLVVRLLPKGNQRVIVLEEQRAGLDPAAIESLGLTRREAEVLAWVAQGKTNAEIATILGVSPGTVKKHMEHVFGKLGVETRTAAAALALEAGRQRELGPRLL